MKLLVIGGTGVLSTAVVAEALRKGVEVTMINRGHRMDRIPEGVRFIKADCRDIQTIETALNGSSFDAVIDFICYDKIIVELKAVKEIDDVHRSQAINYAKVAGFKLSLLFNFEQTSLEKERFPIG